MSSVIHDKHIILRIKVEVAFINILSVSTLIISTQLEMTGSFLKDVVSSLLAVDL